MKGINLLRNHTQKIFSLKNIFSRIHVKPLWLNLFSHSPRTFNTITIFFPKTSMKFLIHDWFQTPLVLVLALFSSLFTAVPSVQCRDEEKLCIKVNKRKLSNKIRHNYRLLWGTFYFYFRPIPQSQLFTSKIKKKYFSEFKPKSFTAKPQGASADLHWASLFFMLLWYSRYTSTKILLKLLKQGPPNRCCDANNFCIAYVFQNCHFPHQYIPERRWVVQDNCQRPNKF